MAHRLHYRKARITEPDEPIERSGFIRGDMTMSFLSEYIKKEAQNENI